MKISAVVLTQNNEKTIKRCLDSISFLDEIIIIDSFSTDSTVEICRSFSKNVSEKKFVCTAFSRNFGLQKARNKWVFFIDSDEEASKELSSSLKSFSPEGNAAAYSVFIRTNYLGAWMKSAALSQWQPRLFRKGKAAWSNRLCHAPPKISGNVSALKGSLLHHSIQSVSSHLKKLDYYTSREAMQKKVQKDNNSLFLFPFRLFVDSSYVFLKRIFFEMAFLDGWRGMVFACISAYYEIVKDFKFFFKKY